MRLFVNRLAYGIQKDKPLPDGTVPYMKQTRPLDSGAVRMHLNGDITINLYAINPQTQSSKWVAIDADYDGSLKALFQLQWELRQDGVDAALEQSRRGGHLWIFAEKPLLASQCRIYIYNLALRLGVPVKGAGLKEGIEVFPRQDEIKEGAYGNAIRAPLGVHRKSNRRYWFYEADLNPEAQMAYLLGLKKLSATDLASLTQGMVLPQAYRPADPEPFVPRPPMPGRQEFRILDYVQTTGKQDSRNWKAQCPSCAQGGGDRSRNNLGIKISDTRFYVCRAGCTKEDIRAALGQPIRKHVLV
ncbi:MAG: TOTE conflict system archaeo-eukaryotic primase domain-containing protein [Acidobacteriaceae bacterium]